MRVKIAHARHDENNEIKYGKAGDQNQEVVISSWYLHDKKWVILRCKDDKKRELIAQGAEMITENNHIGYDQAQRQSFQSALEKNNFDPSKINEDCETDCSGLVRGAICYAYKKDITGSIRTADMQTILPNTGEFELITNSTFCNSPNYLKRGDILVTAVKGHTVVVLNDGSANIKINTSLFFNPDYTGTYKVKVNLNLRYGAGTNSKKILTMKKNAIVTSKGEYNLDGNNKMWLKVYYTSDLEQYVGYCSKSYLTKLRG